VLLYQNTWNWAISKENKLISHNFGDLEAQHQVTTSLRAYQLCQSIVESTPQWQSESMKIVSLPFFLKPLVPSWGIHFHDFMQTNYLPRPDLKIPSTYKFRDCFPYVSFLGTPSNHAINRQLGGRWEPEVKRRNRGCGSWETKGKKGNETFLMMENFTKRDG
jgi:hypothetical protein